MNAPNAKKLLTLIRLAQTARDGEANLLAGLRAKDLELSKKIQTVKLETYNFEWQAVACGFEKCRRSWSQDVLLRTNTERAQLAVRIEHAKCEFQKSVARLDALQKLYDRRKKTPSSAGPGGPYR